MVKKVLGWWTSWALFYVGDTVHVVMDYFEWFWLYPVYNTSMNWSVRIQEWADVKGPWEKNDGN